MRILILNQAFHPDVVSTAQHASDLARALADVGHEVTVLASAHGYDDPRRKFPLSERWHGVAIRRVPHTALGKSAAWRRALDFASFMGVGTLRLAPLGKFDVVVAMTSPPLISFIAALLKPLIAKRLVLWCMDLNPDEAIAAGWLKASSVVCRCLLKAQAYSLKRTDAVIVLDRFMRDRMLQKGVPEDKIAVVPPWSQDDAVRFDREARSRFRAQHGLSDKFVVMYSGNHSVCHPLDTLIESARRLSGHPRIRFCFVGGGAEFTKVCHLAAVEGLSNVVCLPYQPLDKLSGSLSAADLHVVVMGDGFAGIVHPCKIYNILTLGTPFLYIGPRGSHVGDIVAQFSHATLSRCVSHGDVDRVINHIVELSEQTEVAGSEPSQVLGERFARDSLVPLLIEHVESVARFGGERRLTPTFSPARGRYSDSEPIDTPVLKRPNLDHG